MYGIDNYNKVRDIIDARRTEARALADRRSRELAERSSEIAEIDRELSETGPLIFKTACAGGDIAPIKKRNQELVEMRKSAMIKLGFPADYTDVKYTCPLCSDSGYVGVKMCKCFKELLVTENIKSSGIGNIIDEQTFENFDLSVFNYDKSASEIMKNTFERARSFATRFGEGSEKTNLLFIGKTGKGKTHLSSAVARVVISKGYSVLYNSVQNIISDFECDKFKSGYNSGEPVSDKYFECDLLIVDDLGTEFSTQFSISCIYNLLNTRKNRGLSTIISTNLDFKELQAVYDDRIVSRIFGGDYTVLQFEGRDFRLYGKRN